MTCLYKRKKCQYYLRHKHDVFYKTSTVEVFNYLQVIEVDPTEKNSLDIYKRAYSNHKNSSIKFFLQNKNEKYFIVFKCKFISQTVD